MSKLTSSVPFLNVLVKVRPGKEPGTYKVETAPSVLRVTQADTIINFQIFDSGENDIVFTGMKVEPSQNDQFSTPSLSVSRKQLTFSDANTCKAKLNILLNFEDEAGAQFMHDPEVENEPD